VIEFVIWMIEHRITRDYGSLEMNRPLHGLLRDLAKVRSLDQLERILQSHLEENYNISWQNTQKQILYLSA
jgi:hypothetical protein